MLLEALRRQTPPVPEPRWTSPPKEPDKGEQFVSQFGPATRFGVQQVSGLISTMTGGRVELPEPAESDLAGQLGRAFGDWGAPIREQYRSAEPPGPLDLLNVAAPFTLGLPIEGAAGTAAAASRALAREAGRKAIGGAARKTVNTAFDAIYGSPELNLRLKYGIDPIQGAAGEPVIPKSPAAKAAAREAAKQAKAADELQSRAAAEEAAEAALRSSEGTSGLTPDEAARLTVLRRAAPTWDQPASPRKRPPGPPSAEELAETIAEAKERVAEAKRAIAEAIEAGEDADDIAELRVGLREANAELRETRRPFDKAAYDKAIAEMDAEDAAGAEAVKGYRAELAELEAKVRAAPASQAAPPARANWPPPAHARPPFDYEPLESAAQRSARIEEEARQADRARREAEAAARGATGMDVGEGVVDRSGRPESQRAQARTALEQQQAEAAQRGLPSGRRPGGPQNIVPIPPSDEYAKLLRAMRPERDHWIKAVRKYTSKEVWYDRLHPLWKLGEDVHGLAQMTPGAVVRGENIIRRQYQPILRAIGQRDVKHLANYMKTIDMSDDVARGVGRLAGGVNPSKLGELKEGVQEAILWEEKGRRGRALQRYLSIQKAADALWAKNREYGMDLLYKEGFYTPDAHTRIVSAHPHYVPGHRADYADQLMQAFDKPEANVSSTGIRQRTEGGSTKALDKPFERFLEEPIRVQSLIARNRAAKAIVNTLDAQGMVRYVEPKEAMNRAQRVTGEIIPRADEAEQSAEWGTVTFFENGRQVVAEVPAMFAEVAKGLGAEPDGTALRIARALSALPRHGLITYNPVYPIAGVVRDSWSALYREKVIPLGPDWWAGMIAAVSKNALFDEAADAGVLMSGIVENMRRPGSAGRLANPGAISLTNWRGILSLMPRVNTAIERGPRIAAYRKLIGEGVGDIQAAVRARDATVDFAKAGHLGRVMNQVIPFFNASVQGTANTLRTFRSNPAWATAMIGFANTPTFLLRSHNSQFETSKDIPDYEYTRNWVVQLGEGTMSDGTKFPVYVKVPKGEAFSFFTFPAEAMFSLARDTEDRSALELLLQAGIEAANVNLPFQLPTPGAGPIGRQALAGTLGAAPIGSLLTGLYANRDPYTDVPLESEREKRLRPEQRFGEETSATAILLGQKLKVSPRLIDFAIKDYTGGAGQSANWLLSLALDIAGYEKPKPFGSSLSEEPERTALQRASFVPGIARFLGTRNTQQERRGWDQFAEIVDDSNRAFSQIPGMDELGIELGKVDDMVNIIPRASSTAMEITPSQMADLQRLYASLAIPAIQNLVPTLGGTDEDKKERIEELRAQMRREAENRLVDAMQPPEDAEGKAIFAFRALLRTSGYDELEDRHPGLQADPDLRQLYGQYKEEKRSIRRLLDLGFDASILRQLGRVDAEIERSRLLLLRDTPELEIGLIRYRAMAPVTRAGMDFQRALDLEAQKKKAA